MQGSRVAFCQKGTDAMNSKRLIRPMVASDPSVLASAFISSGWNKPESQFGQYYVEQSEGKRTTLVAFAGNEIAGYGNIIWQSDYPQNSETMELWNSGTSNFEL